MGIPRKDFLLQDWQNRIKRYRVPGESDMQYAFRMFRGTNGAEYSWELLSACTGLQPEELQTLAEGTFYRADKPDGEMPTASECIDSFLPVVEKHARVV